MVDLTIKRVDELYSIEDSGPLYSHRLLEIDEASRLVVFKKCAKENGSAKAPSTAVLSRFNMVLGAFESIDWEPVSVRSIYYRIVSIYGEPKTDKVYNDIQRAVSLMRDYGILDFKYIIDGSRNFYALDGYKDAETFINDMASHYRKDLWADSNCRLVIVVEKQAMIEILKPTCIEYGVSLVASKGFNSKTGWYTLCQNHKELGDETITTRVLMFTDYDTAGKRMASSGMLAVEQHGLLGQVFVKRVGLTPDQIEALQLPTREDKENKNMRACELDAMTPTQARELLEEEILRYVDVRKMEVMKTIEAEEREGLEMLKWN